jgi:hypothetical protein
MSHRKNDLGIPARLKSAKVVLGVAISVGGFMSGIKYMSFSSGHEIGCGVVVLLVLVFMEVTLLTVGYALVLLVKNYVGRNNWVYCGCLAI